MNPLTKRIPYRSLVWPCQIQVSNKSFRRLLTTSTEIGDTASANTPSTTTAPLSPSIVAEKEESAPTKTFSVRPRASNPLYYQKRFLEPVEVAGRQIPKIENKHGLNQQNNQLLGSASSIVTRLRKLHQRRQSLVETLSESEDLLLGTQLAQDGDILPKSEWVRVENISPTSSLNAILRGIRQALDVEESRGIVDLDKPWSAGQRIPFLTRVSEVGAPDKWVQKARLILSPYGRPCGWYLKFANRSVVYALLKYARDTPVKCSWRDVRIFDYGQPNVDPTKTTPENANFVFSEEISDNTLRLENVSQNIRETSLLNFFSRYDLRSNPILKWEHRTSDGKSNPPTFLIHFTDAAWARACLREKQATFIHAFQEKIGKKQIILVQYPQQIF